MADHTLPPPAEDLLYTRNEELSDEIFTALSVSTYRPLRVELYVLFDMIVDFSSDYTLGYMIKTNKSTVTTRKKIDEGIELFVDLSDMLLEDETCDEDR